MEDETKKEPRDRSIVARVSKELDEKVRHVAEKHHLTVSTFTERALKVFIDKLEYSFENLLMLVDERPLLKIHKEVIESTFKRTEQKTRKKVIALLKMGDVRVYDYTPQDIINQVPEFARFNPSAITAILRLNPDYPPPEPSPDFKPVIDELEKIVPPKSLFLDIAIDSTIKEARFLIFVLVGKKEGDDAKE